MANHTTVQADQTKAVQAKAVQAKAGVIHEPAWRAERRQIIIDAARHRLRRQSFEQIQIREVAQSAGLALSTLYRYFTSKEHLYAVVLVEWAKPISASANKSLSGIELVRERIHSIIDAYQRNPYFFSTISVLVTSSRPEVRECLSELTVVSHQLFKDEFSSMTTDEQADDWAAILWAAVSTLLASSMRVDNGVSVGEIHRLVDEFLDLIARAQS